MHQELLVAGHRIGGPCDQAVGEEVVRNPYDGSIVGTVAEGGWSELSTCLAAASDSFQTWRHSTIEERIELLVKISKLVSVRREELADLAVREIGKPITMALAEVDRLVRTFDVAVSELKGNPEWKRTKVDVSFDTRSKSAKAFVERRPKGVVFAITPYNWPYNLAAHKIAPALATGNTIVLKPNPLSALCTLTLAHLVQEAGCPPGVINCWNGPTKVVEKGLADPRVSMISFTGSAGVGWQIKTAHPKIPVILELGGNAPAIICRSANLRDAVEKCVTSAYGYAGQVCISLQNLFVHRDVYEEVKGLLLKAVQKLSVGDPVDDKVVCGPLISSSLVDKVQQMIGEAVDGGGKLLAGGEAQKNLLPPQLVEDAPTDSRLMKEEAFGPVLTLTAFDDLESLVQRLNRGCYGIHASVFTASDEDIAVANRLEFGGIVINDAPSLRFDNLPYGGMRDSGFGREGVRYAMLDMTDPTSIVRR
jgi:acyl-CoA reductase-like NAD-dependent aldehyde dehydrogenase